MNTDKTYAEKIASEYAPKEARKVVALKKLDSRAKAPARIFAYAFGIIMTLLLGVGICLSLRIIGGGGTTMMTLGVTAGVIGIIGVSVNYVIYKVTMAAVNLKRRRKSADKLIRLLRTISFIDALVSILTLQNTLIMVMAKGNLSDILPLTAISSGAIWAFILLLSVSALVNGLRSKKA